MSDKNPDVEKSWASEKKYEAPNSTGLMDDFNNFAFPDQSHEDTHRIPPSSSSSSSSSPRSARRFSDMYVVGQKLGEGGFGTVYMCNEIATGKNFACKRMSIDDLTSEEKDMVKCEIKIMKLLPIHPNIIALKETFKDEEYFYLVMELCTGGNLLERMKKKLRFADREAAIIMRDIVQSVKVCHKNFVIHRDLKPENLVFVDNEETSPLKMIDFGLSIIFTPGQILYNEPVGTLLYSAPEVIKENYGPECDIWSAGVILYSLLYGSLPFNDNTLLGLKRKICKGVVDFKREPWPNVSKEAIDLLTKMLQRGPSSRISVEDILEHPWIKSI